MVVDLNQESKTKVQMKEGKVYFETWYPYSTTTDLSHMANVPWQLEKPGV